VESDVQTAGDGPSTGLPGSPGSHWLETSAGQRFTPLDRGLEVDVAVLGAGIVGVTVAYLLSREGVRVAVIEADRVGSGVTGHSTAKLTSLHGLVYERLRSSFGPEIAAAYGEANEAGLSTVATLAEQLAIDCDFRRRDNFTYTLVDRETPQIEREVEVAGELGLPASFVDELDLPFPVAAAIRFSDQAEFHPLRYLAALAEQVRGLGGEIYEQTRATGLEGSSVVTEGGHLVRVERLVVATQIPFLDRGLFFARLSPQRSYALTTRLEGESPAGMYLSTEDPPHSIRPIPDQEGALLQLGGEGHHVGTADSSSAYRRLGRWAASHFAVGKWERRWSSQDYSTLDGMPYVGQLHPLSDRVLTATGFGKWGLAAGTAAAMMLSDRILGRQSQWTSAFDSNRLRPRSSAPTFVRNNLAVGAYFVGDRLKRGRPEIEPGEGGVIGSGLGQRAVYREPGGNLHSLSARCTHLGCLVRWNSAERSWDCPCHGSRFDVDGAVLQGPAVDPLPPT
jgi:glycine/D-amino acid oxidase-like deaminating enzyme/nitrite reductase/ring-hydroxylating ferredoxin subunit